MEEVVDSSQLNSVVLVLWTRVRARKGSDIPFCPSAQPGSGDNGCSYLIVLLDFAAL